MENPINGQNKNEPADDRIQGNAYNADIQPSFNNNSNSSVNNQSQLRNRSNNEYDEGSNVYSSAPVEIITIYKHLESDFLRPE